MHRRCLQARSQRLQAGCINFDNLTPTDFADDEPYLTRTQASRAGYGKFNGSVGLAAYRTCPDPYAEHVVAEQIDPFAA